MESGSRKEKDNVLQIMRAIAIFMVVLQHSIGKVAVTDFENVFMFMLNHIDVPIFFILAGYFFEMKKEKYYNIPILEYCKGKAISLLVPYIFWATAMAMIVFVLFIVKPEMAMAAGLEKWGAVQFIWNTLTFSDYYLQHLWFVYVIFFFFIINRLLKDRAINLVFIICEIVLAAFLFDKIEIFIVKKFVLHFFNFLIGRVIYKHRVLKCAKYMPVKVTALLGLGICFTSELMISNSFTYTYIGNVIYALCGFITVYNWAYYLDIKIKRKNAILDVAQYSYEIYLSHNPYVVMFLPIVLKMIQLNRGVILILSVVLGIVLPCCLAKIIYKTPLSKILYGRG